ncbi:hypothetical protein D3C86_2022540 [compost metagenome]
MPSVELWGEAGASLMMSADEPDIWLPELSMALPPITPPAPLVVMLSEAGAK